jgi:hypothetical protein
MNSGLSRADEAIGSMPSSGALQALKESNAMAVRQTAGGITTASVMKPRQLKGEGGVLARIDLEAAAMEEDVFYTWEVKDKESPTGKSTIIGLSIDGAMMIARNWGNCGVENLDVTETPTGYMMPARFVDFETNFTATRIFHSRKDKSTGGNYGSGRGLEITFAVGQSKATRNVIKACLPAYIQERAIKAAQQNIKSRIEELVKKHSLATVIKSAVEKLKAFEVTEEMILSKYRRSTLGGIDIDDLVQMQCDLRALEKGTETVDALYVMPDKATNTSNDGSRPPSSLDEMAGDAKPTTTDASGRSSLL